MRELENAIERATNLASGDADDGSRFAGPVTVSPNRGQVRQLGTDDERARLLRRSNGAAWNQSRAASQCSGISRTTLWRKMRELRIRA